MANDLDHLLVAHLREVHAELQCIAAKLQEHDRRFDDIRRRLGDFQPVTEHTLGLATMNQIKVWELEARHDAADAWRTRMDERLGGLERRLAKVEEKRDN